MYPLRSGKKDSLSLEENGMSDAKAKAKKKAAEEAAQRKAAARRWLALQQYLRQTGSGGYIAKSKRRKWPLVAPTTLNWGFFISIREKILFWESKHQERRAMYIVRV
jgi:hypothetical protein